MRHDAMSAAFIWLGVTATVAGDDTMVSRGEARSVVETTLAGRGAGRPMTAEELSDFCRVMLTRMAFSRQGRSADIRRWARGWERGRFSDLPEEPPTGA